MDNIKIDLRERELGSVSWIPLALDWNWFRNFANTVVVEFFYQLSYYQLLKKDSAL
jgi:hypothetical protein